MNNLDESFARGSDIYEKLSHFERTADKGPKLGGNSNFTADSEPWKDGNYCQFQGSNVCPSIIYPSTSVSDKLLLIEHELAYRLSLCTFTAPIEYVYNPLDYAFGAHSEFVHKYCKSQKKILFLGMNPGPWGMSQTGIPFGEVTIVKDWLKISGEIGQPSKECPARPVKGYSCKRKEISGWKFWNLFKCLCSDPFKFFSHSFVYNYCPLAFMTGSGKNITPAEMKSSERKIITKLCDKSFCEVLQLLHVDTVIAIGKFAEKSAAAAMKADGLNNIEIVTIPHPSPRNFNTKNWHEETKIHLQEKDLLKFFL